MLPRTSSNQQPDKTRTMSWRLPPTVHSELLELGPIKFLRRKQQSCYPYCHSLLVLGSESLLIDPGADKDFFRELAARQLVTQIFLSHYHEDHRKYLYFFSGCSVRVPAAEVPAFASLAKLWECFGVGKGLYRQYLEEVVVPEFRLQPLLTPQAYNPWEEYRLGGVNMVVWPAPGHTPGHSCFYFPEQGIIYLADLDLTPFGPWYGDAASDLEALWHSLDAVAQCPARIFLTAHGQGIFSADEAPEAFARYRQVIRDREVRLLQRLQQPRTLEELVAERLIYRPDLQPVFVYDHLERQMISQHLAWLERRGLVYRQDEVYVAT